MQPRFRFRKLHDIKPKQLSENAPYLAGLMDGEGTWTLKRTTAKNVRFQPVISLSMTHLKTIQFAAEVFGVSLAKGKRRKRFHKLKYYLRVTTKQEIKEVSEALLRYSITKRDQIELMLKFLALEDETKSEGGTSCSQISKKKIRIYIKLRKLNHRGKAIDYEKMRRALEKRASRKPRGTQS